MFNIRIFRYTTIILPNLKLFLCNQNSFLVNIRARNILNIVCLKILWTMKPEARSSQGPQTTSNKKENVNT